MRILCECDAGLETWIWIISMDELNEDNTINMLIALEEHKEQNKHVRKTKPNKNAHFDFEKIKVKIPYLMFGCACMCVFFFFFILIR